VKRKGGGDMMGGNGYIIELSVQPERQPSLISS